MKILFLLSTMKFDDNWNLFLTEKEAFRSCPFNEYTMNKSLIQLLPLYTRNIEIMIKMLDSANKLFNNIVYTAHYNLSIVG